MSVHATKLLSMVLAGACGVLLLLSLALQAGLGRGYSWLEPDPDKDPGLAVAAIDREVFKLPPESNYADTDARPLFNEDRKPTPDTPDEPVATAPQSGPMNISLTGVVLTPKVHMALIQDKSKNNSISLKEGMPMPGDQGGWILAEVRPRSAVFKELSGEEVEVELSTAVAGQKNAAPPRAGAAPAAGGARPAPVAAAATGNNPPGNPQAIAQTNPQAAEQLQRRIEERRKQMRDEAERMKKQQNPQNPPQH